MAFQIDLHNLAPLVSSGGSTLYRSGFLDFSSRLADQLRREAIGRVLIVSDNPFRILAAIAACNEVSADLWIAHTNIAPNFVQEISTKFGIQMTITSADELAVPNAWGSPPRRGIYLMTSGTTGQPKIVRHTLESLLGRIQKTATFPGGQRSRWLLTYQPTAFAGLQVILTAALSGGTIVVSEHRTPVHFFEAAERHQVTHISGTPTFWRSFLLMAQPGSLPDLQQITLGGEAIDQATLDRLKVVFPKARVTHIYASTEAGVVFSVHDGQEGFPAEWLEGTTLQDVRMRVHEGMLEVKTSRGMAGYEGETIPLTEDGWIRTGDLVEVVSGRVRFIGREDSILNVGGAKVHPQVIESFLLSLPGVREARVRGVANPISGFLVGAEIVLDDLDQQESQEIARRRILARCREFLPGYQIPRILRIVDSIPVQDSGKKG
jgi:acyl-coenzyme A synthetase/AMP-(fatty) acid ligase